MYKAVRRTEIEMSPKFRELRLIPHGGGGEETHDDEHEKEKFWLCSSCFFCWSTTFTDCTVEINIFNVIVESVLETSFQGCFSLESIISNPDLPRPQGQTEWNLNTRSLEWDLGTKLPVWDLVTILSALERVGFCANSYGGGAVPLM